MQDRNTRSSAGWEDPQEVVRHRVRLERVPKGIQNTCTARRFSVEAGGAAGASVKNSVPEMTEFCTCDRQQGGDTRTALRTSPECEESKEQPDYKVENLTS